MLYLNQSLKNVYRLSKKGGAMIMARGGARKGAGRKKSAIEKKMCTFRLTEDERAFMKEALNKYRNGSADEEPAKQPSNDSLPVQQSNSTNEDQDASLLAHLEDLFKRGNCGRVRRGSPLPSVWHYIRR